MGNNNLSRAQDGCSMFQYNVSALKRLNVPVAHRSVKTSVVAPRSGGFNREAVTAEVSIDHGHE